MFCHCTLIPASQSEQTARLKLGEHFGKMEWKGHPMHGPRKNPRYFHPLSLLCYGLGLFGVAALALGAWKNTNLGEQKHVDNIVHMRHYGALPCEPSVPKQLKVAIVGLVKVLLVNY